MTRKGETTVPCLCTTYTRELIAFFPLVLVSLFRLSKKLDNLMGMDLDACKMQMQEAERLRCE